MTSRMRGTNLIVSRTQMEGMNGVTENLGAPVVRPALYISPFRRDGRPYLKPGPFSVVQSYNPVFIH